MRPGTQAMTGKLAGSWMDVEFGDFKPEHIYSRSPVTGVWLNEKRISMRKPREAH